MDIAATRILGARRSIVLAAVGPALAAAAGVIVGAGAVSIAWEGRPVLLLILGTIAGGIGGTALLRVMSPETFRELRMQFERMTARARPAVAARSSAP